jgi:hypothetical protein
MSTWKTPCSEMYMQLLTIPQTKTNINEVCNKKKKRKQSKTSYAAEIRCAGYIKHRDDQTKSKPDRPIKGVEREKKENKCREK